MTEAVSSPVFVVTAWLTGRAGRQSMVILDSEKAAKTTIAALRNRGIEAYQSPPMKIHVSAQLATNSFLEAGAGLQEIGEFNV